MHAGPSPHVRELFSAALSHHQGGRFSEARRLYEQILHSHPRHVDALHLHGVLAHQTGRHEDAVHLIGKAIAENPRIPAFYNNLGNALKAQGKLEDADAAYERALMLNPQYYEAYYNRGLVRQAQGRWDEAVENYGRVLAHQPRHADAHNNLGNALQALGRLDEALAAYGRALQVRPNFTDALNNAGNVLRAQGNATGAIDSYTRALSHDARHVDALRNLGIVLLEQGRLEESAGALQRALAIKPQDAANHCNLGNTFLQQGRAALAISCYRRALELNADLGEAALGLAVATIPVLAENVAASQAAAGEFSRALDELGAWHRDHPGSLGRSIGSHQPFYLAYRGADVGGLLARYGDITSAAATEHWQPRTPLRRAGGERLRIVIVCGQLRRHPVWDVIVRGIVAHLDRQRFELHLYHTAGLHDAETAWARERADRFIQGPKPLRFWLEEIANDRPDIIFYPEIGMDPTTCALAALRLAPVQAASWGHPITSGLPTIDYFVSGELIEDPEAEKHYRERLVRLPGTGVCTDASALRAEPWEAPAAARDVVRFGICQQPTKFDPAYDEWLVRIAEKSGACEFWLPSPVNLPWAAARLHQRLAAAFREAGLEPDAHLKVLPWLPGARFLGFLDRMDVFLDCPAFSGYTTAWQALHRGTPVVTLQGTFMRQRLAAGLLRQVGITDGVVATRQNYIETAVRFAQQCRDPKRRRRLRESMIKAAPRADGNVAAVRAFEEVLAGAVAAQGRS
jgi:predicted O-linked N-acetylglucosamine transferase (SPINDLY family)